MGVPNAPAAELADRLGTHVPNLHRADELLTHVRRAWGALCVIRILSRLSFVWEARHLGRCVDPLKLAPARTPPELDDAWAC